MELIFIISSVIAFAGGLLVVTQRNAVYALLALLLSFGGTAGVFYSLDAAFIAVSQILIYAGAIAVLFLFVLMFTDTRTVSGMGEPRVVGSRSVFSPKDPKVEARRQSTFGLPDPVAALVAIALMACLTVAILKLPENFSVFKDVPDAHQVRTTDPTQPSETLAYGSTEGLAVTIFKQFPLAFEVVSLLIFAACIGAVLLSRRHQQKQEGGHA